MFRRALLITAALLSPVSTAGQEGAGGREIRLEFEGNRGISSRALKRVLAAWTAEMRRQGVDEGAAADAAYELERHYHSRGYRAASAAWSWVREEEAETIRFVIAEGPRSHLESLALLGNQRLEGLEDCFPWLRSGFLGLGREVFTEEVLETGLDCVVSRYQLEGFHFVQVQPSVRETPSAEVEVTVRVEEGPQVWLGGLPDIEGAAAFPLEELQRALDLELPASYVPALPQVLRGRLVDFYRDRGYRFVEVSAYRQVDRERALAFLSFQVKEGPLTRVEEVRISGNERTLEAAIRKRIKLRAGDLHGEARLRETYRGLLGMGVFSAVDVDSEALEGRPDRVRLDVEVAEKARFRTGFLLGYGSYELLRGAVFLEDSNLFHRAHRTRLEARASFRGERLLGEYLNPYFIHERLSHRAQAFYERREHPSFTEAEWGGETGVGFRATRRIQGNLQYRLRRSDAVDVDPDIPAELAQDVLVSSVVLSSAAEYRNNVVDPHRGSTHRLAVEYAGESLGSDLDFVRLTAFTSWAFPLRGGVRLLAAARAGAIRRLEDTEVIPIQERFFSGGEYSVRSFEEDQAGPEVNGEPIGGEAFTTYNLELRFPLPWLERLEGAVFGDAGTVNEAVEDFGGGRYFFAVGGGVRYLTPLGPLRLDLAVNPDRGPDEDLLTLHFGLGYPF